MAGNLNLVNAAAGKRLLAWLLDAVPAVIAVMVFAGANAGSISRGAYATSAELAASMATPYLVLTAVLLAYGIALWGWEAATGKTPGNLALGLRTCDEDGFAPGWGRVFLRRLVVGLANIVPVAGPVVVLLSNLWDPNHQRQGWHDKIARTLVVDVSQGRDPITSGGLFGPSAFAPGGGTVHGQAGHPDFVPAPSNQFHPAAGYDDGAPINSVPGGHDQGPAPLAARTREPASAPASARGTVPAPASAPVPAPASARGTVPTVADRDPMPATGAPDPDEEFGHTRMRPGPAGHTAPGSRLVFDDGQVLLLQTTALVGRNPAAAAGEDISELVNYADMGRSVSKTHLHLASDRSGVWVTDRDSTNGSGITGFDGRRRQLAPGQPQHANHGETVHFGDRFFKVEPS